jgi:hypothetical protein
MPLLIILLVSLLSLAAHCQERDPAEISHFSLGNGKTIHLETRECSDKGERLFVVSVKSSSRPAVILKSVSQSCLDSPTGYATFENLEKDGSAYIRIIGSCGNGASCESDLYKVSSKGTSILHYYSGGTGAFQRVGKYLVTDSRGGCCSWEYLAYDLTATHSYPIGHEFQYSIYIEAIESTTAGEVLKSKCEISRMNAAKKLAIVDAPPRELLRFCEHYGKKYVLTKRKHAHKN